MSDLPPISTKFGVDTGDFKSQITTISREIRVLESGFQASAARLGDWANSATGLEERAKSLTGQIDLQRQKVAALQAQYNAMKAEGKASAAAMDEQQLKINGATKALNKMQFELEQDQQALAEMGKESTEAGKDVDNLGEKSEDTSGKLDGLGKVAEGLGTVLKVGMAAIVGLAAAIGGVGAAVTKLVFDTATASGELTDLSAKTGISTERLQELAYISDQVGTSTETMTGSMARLTRSMDDARQKADGELAQAFNRLGVNTTDVNGGLRDSEVVFADVLDALGRVQNATERDALAMQIFGKSALELNPLILAGSGELARLSEEAHQVGAVMSGESVQAMADFDDQMSSLKAGLKGTLGTLAGAFLPGFEQGATKAKGYLVELASAVSAGEGDLALMLPRIGALFAQVVQDVAVAGPEMLQAGLGLLQGIINAIMQSMPVLIPAAVGMITSLVEFLTANLPLMVQAGIELLMALVNGILPELPALVTAAVGIITTLANGLATAIPKLLPVIAEIIPQVVIALIDALPALIDAALQLIVALIEGLSLAIPILIEYVPEIIQAVFDALITALPLIGEAAVELVIALVKGIADSLPAIGEAVPMIIDTLVSGVAALGPALHDMGEDILNGIWKGLQENASTFKRNWEKFWANLIDGVKKILGIKSPSVVFAGIGENMALGLGMGFGRSFAQVETQMARSMRGITWPEMGFDTPGITRAPGGGGGRQVNVQVDARGAGGSDMQWRRRARWMAQEFQKRS